jgi:hypothetical protein
VTLYRHSIIFTLLPATQKSKTEKVTTEADLDPAFIAQSIAD